MTAKSPFAELMVKYGVSIDYRPFIQVIEVSPKEFRSQHINLLDYTAVVFTSKKTIDCYFHLCEAMRITVPETMKYVCSTEAYALYLQKYIVYRKRKISFADGSSAGLLDLISRQKEEKFLLAMSDPHKPELPDAMDRMGLDYKMAIMARTVSSDIDRDTISSYDMVVLYSPWDVKTICEKCGIDGLPLVATFGEGTRNEAEAKGISVVTKAPTAEVPSMTKALDIYLAEQKKALAASARAKK